MSDPAVVDAAVSSVTTPDAAPPAQVPVPADEAPPDHAADLAAAVATMKAAKAQPPAAPPVEAKPAEPAAGQTVVTKTDESTSVPASEKPAEEDPDAKLDAKLSRVFNRVSALEEQLNAAQAEAAKNAVDAERARKRDKAFEEFKRNPAALFEEVGWEPDTIREYIISGPKAPAVETAKVSKETQALAQQLADLKRELAQRDEAAQMAAAKSRVPEILKPSADKFPTLFAYYDDHGEMADVLLNVMTRAHQEQKQITLTEAAESVERVLADQAKRFSRASSKSSEPSSPTAPTSKPASPTLTTVPTGSATKPPEKSLDDMTDQERFELAKQTMRAARVAQK